MGAVGAVGAAGDAKAAGVVVCIMESGGKAALSALHKGSRAERTVPFRSVPFRS